MKTTLASRLAVLRGTQTKQQFAKLLGIPQNSYLRYEDPSDATLPKVDILEKISKTCGISADWLLGLKEDKKIASSLTISAHEKPCSTPVSPCPHCHEKDEVIMNLSKALANARGPTPSATAAPACGAADGVSKERRGA